MTLVQLEYLVAVATYRSFVAAAEKSYVTQPTLSMQVQKLEEELGIKLFDRNTQPITVTPIGQAIVDQAKMILSEAGQINELVQMHQNRRSGTLRFGVIPTIAPYILPGLLQSFPAKYPDVKLQVKEMETHEIIRALTTNTLDAGLLSTPLEDPQIREYPLFYEPFVAYFSKNEKPLKKKLVNSEDIELDRTWMLQEGHCMRNQVLNFCGEPMARVQEAQSFRYESGNVETLKRLVDSNGGMTILPEMATSDFDEQQMERIRYFEAPEPTREIALVTNQHFVKLVLLDALREEIIRLVPEKVLAGNATRNILSTRLVRALR